MVLTRGGSGSRATKQTSNPAGKPKKRNPNQPPSPPIEIADEEEEFYFDIYGNYVKERPPTPPPLVFPSRDPSRARPAGQIRRAWLPSRTSSPSEQLVAQPTSAAPTSNSIQMLPITTVATAATADQERRSKAQPDKSSSPEQPSSHPSSDSGDDSASDPTEQSTSHESDAETEADSNELLLSRLRKGKQKVATGRKESSVGEKRKRTEQAAPLEQNGHVRTNSKSKGGKAKRKVPQPLKTSMAG